MWDGVSDPRPVRVKNSTVQTSWGLTHRDLRASSLGKLANAGVSISMDESASRRNSFSRSEKPVPTWPT